MKNKTNEQKAKQVKENLNYEQKLRRHEQILQPLELKIVMIRAMLESYTDAYVAEMSEVEKLNHDFSQEHIHRTFKAKKRARDNYINEKRNLDNFHNRFDNVMNTIFAPLENIDDNLVDMGLDTFEEFFNMGFHVDTKTKKVYMRTVEMKIKDEDKNWGK